MSSRLASTSSPALGAPSRTNPSSLIAWLGDVPSWFTLSFFLLVLWSGFRATDPFAAIHAFALDRGWAAFMQGIQFGFPVDIPFIAFLAVTTVVDAKGEYHWLTFTTFAATLVLTSLMASLGGVHLHPFLASYLLLVPIGIVVLDNLVNSRFKKPRLLFAVLFGAAMGLWLESKGAEASSAPAPDISRQLLFTAGLLLMQLVLATALFFAWRWLMQKVKQQRTLVVIPVSLLAGAAVVVMVGRILMN
jgi:hypothetical protein